MAKLAFCDYYNMVAILEKTELNADFHQIMDFHKVFHIRQRTITKSSIRRHLKLKMMKDRKNIAKTSAMPHEASPRVTSLSGGEDKSRLLSRMRRGEKVLLRRMLQTQGGVDQGEDLLVEDTMKDSDKSADKRSGNTDVMANVLGTLGAANVLAGGGLKAKFAQKDQLVREQAERDDEIARVHAERELGMMIAEHDRSNEMVAKYLSEYEQAEAELSHNEKVELIDELLKYQRNLAQIKKYHAQQNKPATKTERRNLYMSILRSNAGWKVKDFKGMSFEQIEEKFFPVWKHMQDFMPMNSKLESERHKRPGIQQETSKKQKFAKEEESKSPIVEKKDSDDHDKIINLQQWAVLVSEEVSVDVTPFTVKSPICDWKIFKDRLRDVYQIFRVGQAPKAYPYFFSMLKEFDREDVVMFEPVASDGLWQYQAPIKYWKLYSSCRVHCLSMEGMFIYMLDNVEYPLPKSTLQRMLNHKCEEIRLGLILYRAPCAIKGVLRLE
ncbi:hypothetical protein Tco_0183725 [Tanacetum coccineum]